MKMYQAVSESICIAEFGPELLPGWYATNQEALAAFKAKPGNGQAIDAPARKKPGPKPKAK